ncbi:uncharacterized protein SCODWIG_01753 [Saccharomycodes ludwigii]|uniref:Protein YTP1 n=1 Tax=Saccharomycodes ludwigii TaxID=36035 RepID=A0A376B5T7_9ASCO|nr:uncharacterized protein SCODWIG_01753 [Saccharomycodes ludwigii]
MDDTDQLTPVDTQNNEMDSPEIVPIPHEVMHMHGVPILQKSLTAAERLYWENYDTTTYFTDSNLGNRNAFWYHVFSLVLSAFVLYPICLALNNIGSNWYLPILTLTEIMIISSLFSLSIFDSSVTESLYPHHIYRVFSWILFFIVQLHYTSAVLLRAFKWISGNKGGNIEDSGEFYPLGNYYRDEPDEEEEHLSSSPATTLTNNRSSSNSTESVANDITADLESSSERLFSLNAHRFKGKMSLKRDSILSKVFSNPTIKKLSLNFSTLASIIFHLLNYFLFLFLLVDVFVGLAVGNLFGKGLHIFNLLAHWIKGGVFFLLGVISLARYCGFGANKGWAWNAFYISDSNVSRLSNALPRGGITLEGVESFLIFFYGSTNVFLEHLASQDGIWTPKDLQHISIAFLYIGAGLCGILVEIFLNTWKFEHAKATLGLSNVKVANLGFSPNPLPAFTIFWTGILMSKHAQTSELSTAIHVQWGSMLSYGSFFRVFTFLYLLFVPTHCARTLPSQPLTELITSFCLMGGGLIFMESTDQVIEAMEYRGYTEMFTFNLSLGVVTLIMSWEMMLFMWKGWLKKRMMNN